MSEVIVFDCYEWSKIGDIDHNARFWKPATIVKERVSSNGDVVVDVIFKDGRKSNGHFKRGVICQK